MGMQYSALSKHPGRFPCVTDVLPQGLCGRRERCSKHGKMLNLKQEGECMEDHVVFSLFSTHETFQNKVGNKNSYFID